MYLENLMKKKEEKKKWLEVILVISTREIEICKKEGDFILPLFFVKTS
jgi:hypothetical protein